MKEQWLHHLLHLDKESTLILKIFGNIKTDIPL